MRVMVIVKASKDSEAGMLPSTKLLAKMGEFNKELSKNGIMLAGEGLETSAKGVRVKFSGDQHKVMKGPFGATEELVAGFWVWQVRSMEEAIGWLKRAPFGAGAEVEIRRVLEAADFGESLTPELLEQEARMRQQAAGQK
jgi:hypothetical protein